MKNPTVIRRFGLIFSIVLGLASLASFGKAEAQVVSSPSQGICISLSYNLGEGDSSPSVTSLQAYLNVRGYLSHAPTGYFGSLTYAAVQNFQANNSIPDTGFVGPLTRAAIQSQSCGGVPIPTPGTIGVSLESANPTSGPVGTTVILTGNGFTDDNRVNFGGGAVSNVPAEMLSCSNMGGVSCASDGGEINFTIPSSIGPYCAPGAACPMYMQLVTPGTYPISVTNANGTSNTLEVTVTDGTSGGPLSISGIVAPNSIPVGTAGTWTVNVNAAQSTDLHYSVIWGDEATGSGGFAAPTASPIYSGATFTHTYLRAGTYDPMFTVTDDYGHSVSSSASILVTPLY